MLPNSRTTPPSFKGSWHIEKMELWDCDVLDLVTEARYELEHADDDESDEEDDEEVREALAASMKEVALHVGRNASCPCGSGKKYKRCCGMEVRPAHQAGRATP